MNDLLPDDVHFNLNRCSAEAFVNMFRGIAGRKAAQMSDTVWLLSSIVNVLKFLLKDDCDIGHFRRQKSCFDCFISSSVDRN